MLRLIHGQQKPIEIQTVQVNKPRNYTDNNDDLQKRENLMGKNQFLSWVGADDCVKDKVTRNYAIQMMGIDAMETKPSQPKDNHYKFMKQKVKSTDVKNGNEMFKDCQKHNGKKKRTQKKNLQPH